MLTTDQIITQIVNQLQIIDPGVSAEVGTPEREMIEAVAELIAGQQVDFTVLNQQHDISSMSGGRLDAYLSTYNFGRQQATPSYGTVVFSRPQPGAAITIQRGVQVIANTGDSVMPTLSFVLTDTVVLDTDSTSVDATVQCTVGGSIGNIDANTITSFGGLTSITGITTVNNPQAMTGGTDLETDDQYRTRFQNSFLRNISGTTDMYLALAVAMNGVTKANVVGPISRYQEYLQVPDEDDNVQITPYDSTGTTIGNPKRTSAQSDIPYSKYTYTENYFLTNGTLDPAQAQFYIPGVDYYFNTPAWDSEDGDFDFDNGATNPNVTFFMSGGQFSDDLLVLLEQAYISINSRNDITIGVLNCVDVFVNGEQALAVDSVEVVPTAANDLQPDNSLIWTYQDTGIPVINFKRAIDSQPCDIGNRLQPLYWQPVLDCPDSIQIGQDTYYKANFFNGEDFTYYGQYDGITYSFPAHFAVMEEVNSLYGTVRSRSGIEWFLSGNNYLPGQLSTDTAVPFSGGDYSGDLIDTLTGTQYIIEGYTFDQNISDLQATMESNKQVTSDVLVHKATLRYFRPMVTLMYSFGATQAVVNASIVAALSSFFEQQYYGVAIQLSDILQVIHNVPGVDNVRWSVDTDDAPAHIEEVNADGTSIVGGPFYFDNDFFIQDNQLAASPSANQVTTVARAQNTWTA